MLLSVSSRRGALILCYRRNRHLSLCNEEALHEESDTVCQR